MKSSAVKIGNSHAPLNSGNEGKKITIRPFKVTPKVPDNMEQEYWTILEDALRCIFRKSPTKQSKEQLYRMVEELCQNKFSEKVFTKLMKECNEFIISNTNRYIGQSCDASVLLRLVQSMWRDHCDVIVSVRNVFLFLDRSYVLSLPSVRGIWEQCIVCLRDYLESQANDSKRLTMALLSTLEEYRDGKQVDHDSLQSCLSMLSNLGLYAKNFELPFLEDSRRFFAAEGNSLIVRCDLSMFCHHIERRLNEVSDMTDKFLDDNTKASLVEIIEGNLFLPHASTLLEKGLVNLLDNNNVPDLRLLNSFIERSGLDDKMNDAWMKYIMNKCTEMFDDHEREKTLIDDTLEFYSRVDAILKIAFQNKLLYRNGLRNAIETSINAKSSRTAELMAKYIDKRLRSGEKTVSNEADTEVSLDKLIVLFKLLQGKDMFEAFYKKYLAKRLLLGKSSSYELEKNMLSRLKTECGSGFTSKLEGMFQDIELSKDIMIAYQDSTAMSLRTGDVPLPEFSIHILTNGFWPSSPQLEGLRLPSSLTEIMRSFENFYNAKYQGRRLTWVHNLQRCVVVARFQKGKKELELTLFQAIVLLCFNTNSRLGYMDILNMTGLEDEECRRLCQSLACGIIGTRVLTKEPKGKDVNTSDEFFINEGFQNKLFRIKINAIQAKETVEEVEKTHEEVFRERVHQVDAAIVRTMKIRRHLSHQDLISELLSQLRFPARVSDLKARIESLIERDYLERNSDDSSFYDYLA